MTGQGTKTPQNVYSWLRDEEARYAPLLRRVSLVVEANLDPDEVAKAARAIGGVYRYQAHSVDAWARLDRYPATLIAAMVGSATRNFENNTYWPHFFDSIEVDRNLDREDEFRKALMRAIGRLGLRRAESRRAYLDSLLMHAGIPDSCLADLLNLLIDRKAQDPGLGAVSFMGWALDPNGSNRLTNLAVPVRNFLLQSGDLALDIIERTMEVLAYLEERRDPSALDGLTSETTGLPESMIRKFRTLVVAGEVSLERLPQINVASRQRQDNPRLELDWIQGSILLALPSCSTQTGSVTWTVSADGDVSTATSKALWIGGTAQVPAARLQISKPAKQVHVVRTGSGSSTDLSLVDPGDPLLLFDDDGSLLVPTLPIPYAPVWAMWPNGARLVSSNNDRPTMIVEEAPAQWPGWRMAQIDATSVKDLRLIVNGREGRVRKVRQELLPEIVLSARLSGIRSPGGLPVYSNRPIITLPGDGGTGVRWDVDVRRLGAASPVVSRTGVLAGSASAAGLLGEIRHAMLGVFTIQVRGPLGRKIRRTVALAEGLTIDYDPAVRMPTGQDLVPALAVLCSGAGWLPTPISLSFSGKEVEKAATLLNGDQTMSVLVAPPHVEMLFDATGIAPTWSPEIRRLSADSFLNAGDLLIRPPTEVEIYSLELRASRGGETQSTQPAARRSGDYRFNLARFADTARRVQWAELIAHSSLGQIAVARLRPRSHASAAQISGSSIDLIDCGHATDLLAAVYPVTAPWLGFAVCDVSEDSTIQIPAEFGEGGDLLIYLAEDDGWGTVEWPRWPTQDFIRASRPGHRTIGTSFEQQISAMIGDPNLREVLICEPDEVANLWATMAVVDHIMDPDHRQHLVSEIRRILHLDATRSALALASIQRGAAEAIELLVRSRLTECRFSLPTNIRNLHGLWSQIPVVSSMVSSAAVVAQPSHDLIDDEIAADIAVFGGIALQEIVAGRSDPHRESANFDLRAKILAGKTKRDLDEIWLAAQIVPQGLLHIDSRVTAARELFDQRDTKELQRALERIGDEIKSLKRELIRLNIPGLNDQLAARLDVGPSPQLWQFLPVLSFVLATRARLSAWVPHAVTPLTVGNWSKWRVLSKLAPNFVAMDIALADTLIAGAYKPAAPGEYR